MAEINLNVSLKVAGQKRSDKYLISNVEKKKTKKKSKKKKHRSERYEKIFENLFYFQMVKNNYFSDKFPTFARF